MISTTFIFCNYKAKDLFLSESLYSKKFLLLVPFLYLPPIPCPQNTSSTAWSLIIIAMKNPAHTQDAITGHTRNSILITTTSYQPLRIHKIGAEIERRFFICPWLEKSLTEGDKESRTKKLGRKIAETKGRSRNIHNRNYTVREVYHRVNRSCLLGRASVI